MLSQLVGKEVLVVMGISMSRVSGFDDNLRGKIVEIEGEWLTLTQKKETAYINIAHIKRIIRSSEQSVDRKVLLSALFQPE